MKMPIKSLIVCLSAALLFVACRAATPPPRAAHPQANHRSEARLAYAGRQYDRCASLFHQASADGKDTAGDAYDAGCCRARAGDHDGAFVELQRAVELGFKNATHLATDEDLATLRSDARWATLSAAAQARHEAYLNTVNRELHAIFQEDQGDRNPAVATSLGLDGKTFAERDRRRRERVQAILDAAGAKVSDDFYHAAMVFQHGGAPADITRAHALALRATQLTPVHANAKWLAAASEDRYLMYVGKPQRYGTQFRVEKGRWVLYNVDPNMTDEERARWNAPPLAEVQRAAEKLNHEMPPAP